jgi:MerR HTH family regulatory protein
MDGTWTIGELAERASTVLAADGQGQVSGRVRETPNDRLIRWYATIGLVDPPLSRAGRVARYGRRHLLQLIAVKRRQADGLSLAEIQAELVGATDAYLESVASLPAGDVAMADAVTADGARADGVEVAADGHPDRRGPVRDGRFWAAAARPRAATRSGTAVAPAGAAEPEPLPADFEPQTGDLLQGLRLAPGVVLLLEAGPSVIPVAAAADLRAAAAPLLTALARHGYHAGTDDRERKQP